MPVNQNCFFKVNIGESEYQVKFTAQVMREFIKSTECSLFDFTAWIDDDDKVFIALELSLKAAGNNDTENIISEMSLEDVGIFKAQIMLMISNIDDLQKKILIPLTLKTEKAQIQQQTQQMQILMELSKQQSITSLSESAVLPDTK